MKYEELYNTWEGGKEKKKSCKHYTNVNAIDSLRVRQLPCGPADT